MFQAIVNGIVMGEGATEQAARDDMRKATGWNNYSPEEIEENGWISPDDAEVVEVQ